MFIKGDVRLDKIIEFKCVPERLVYNSTDFKIYGVSVNSFEYPNVQIGKYGTATIKGNISELNLGIDYIVKAKEVSDSHGVGYNVINIKREKPTTLAATRNFLYEILTPNQTDVLLEAYPDIVDRIMNNRLDDIDLSRTKGIKDYTFNVIKNKVIENFKLAEIVEEFRGLFNLSTVKKLYDKGFVDYFKRGVKFYYPVRTEEDYIQSELKRTREFWFDGSRAELLSALFKDEQITEEEKKELNNLIEGL